MVALCPKPFLYLCLFSSLVFGGVRCFVSGSILFPVLFPILPQVVRFLVASFGPFVLRSSLAEYRLEEMRWPKSFSHPLSPSSFPAFVLFLVVFGVFLRAFFFFFFSSYRSLVSSRCLTWACWRERVNLLKPL